MVSRVSLMLRGIASAVGQPRSVAECWLPFAREVLREEEGRLKGEREKEERDREAAAKKGHFAKEVGRRAIANSPVGGRKRWKFQDLEHNIALIKERDACKGPSCGR